MTQKTYETALHMPIELPSQKPLRQACTCFMGRDIGAYNTCLHLCRYCYANYDEETVRKNYSMHDPDSPFLIGHAVPEDVVRTALQKSWIDRQLRLEF